jgi:hypothetical protein
MLKKCIKAWRGNIRGDIAVAWNLLCPLADMPVSGLSKKKVYASVMKKYAGATKRAPHMAHAMNQR